jgi:hypothetical protein
MQQWTTPSRLSNSGQYDAPIGANCKDQEVLLGVLGHQGRSIALSLRNFVLACIRHSTSDIADCGRALYFPYLPDYLAEGSRQRLHQRAMYRRLTKTTRWRVAATFTLAYALCVFAPPLALAFEDSARALHCLTVRHEHRSPAAAADALGALHSHKTHAHRDAAGHQDHGSQDTGKPPAGGMGAASDCCGYLCLSAIPAGPVPWVGPQERIIATEVLGGPSIAGRGPDRIDRPPIVPLPV